ncbi:hypothetical protein DL770_010243 [Monosporascus sp. CRB-9-2]|nr:hypothetical protein DL770_010243 [Monosporascus sp. CRB-9-2]
MLICGVLAAEYIIKVLRYKRHVKGIVQTQENHSKPKAHIFQYAVIFACFPILVRSIYWTATDASPRMLALATAALTLLRTGFLYPYMNSDPKEERKQNGSSSEQLRDARL